MILMCQDIKILSNFMARVYTLFKMLVTLNDLIISCNHIKLIEIKIYY